MGGREYWKGVTEARLKRCERSWEGERVERCALSVMTTTL